MNASELLRAGQLAEAIDAEIKALKANPGDQERRVFLFELLAFAGELDRARRQIEAVKYDEPALDAAALGYRKLLDSEALRRRLFSESLKPEFFSEPPDHLRLRLEAVNRLREGRPQEARELLTQADANLPVLRGKLNGKDFEGLRDGDDLFSYLLEVMAHGRYYWVPLEQVESLTMPAPRFQRDLLWVPARLGLHDGASGEVFLPALYPGSHEHPDPRIKLGRATDWKGPEGGPVRGVGLREFLVGDDSIPLREWRELVVEAAPAA
jgi:type VI secretion system protein ImpE